MTSLDPDWVRPQFPALSRPIAEKVPVFFDGPGGTQVPARVSDAMGRYLQESNANAHGAFATSRDTDALIGATRLACADFLGCGPDEVVFGANMTTLTFALSRAIGRELASGDEIVVTCLDHDANVMPWRVLEEKGAVIRTAEIHPEDCTLDLTDLEHKVNERTRLIAIGYASNAVGTVNDVAAAIRLGRSVGAWTFVDAVHYAPHGPIDVRALDCDFLACSAYKFYGPHVGVLYGRREHLERLRPYKLRPALDEVPVRWETGTLNHEGLAGLSATIGYLAELGRRVSPGAATRRDQLVTAMAASREYERGLSEVLIGSLLEIPGLTLYGITDPARLDHRTPTVAVRLAGQTPFALAKALGDRGIFTWHGNFYALGLSERLGVEATGGFLRIGLVAYNTRKEIGRLIEALAELAGK